MLRSCSAACPRFTFCVPLYYIASVAFRVVAFFLRLPAFHAFLYGFSSRVIVSAAFRLHGSFGTAHAVPVFASFITSLSSAYAFITALPVTVTLVIHILVPVYALVWWFYALWFKTWHGGILCTTGGVKRNAC